MKYPLKIKNMQNASVGKCIWCKCKNVSEPNSMAILSAGALFVNRKTGDGGPDPRLDGFLCLTWHGAHTNEGGQGHYSDKYKVIHIAKDVLGGQFNLNFCSIKCLREFINNAVDKLEKSIVSK
jgi:hypothetical protein